MPKLAFVVYPFEPASNLQSLEQLLVLQQVIKDHGWEVLTLAALLNTAEGIMAEELVAITDRAGLIFYTPPKPGDPFTNLCNLVMGLWLRGMVSGKLIPVAIPPYTGESILLSGIVGLDLTKDGWKEKLMRVL